MPKILLSINKNKQVRAEVDFPGILISYRQLGAMLFLVLLSGMFWTTTGVKAYKERIACKMFATAEARQAAYDSDPVKYKLLDRDHDGKACE